MSIRSRFTDEEFIRPEPRLLVGLTGYQWAALALAPAFMFLWWRDQLVMRKVPVVPIAEA